MLPYQKVLTYAFGNQLINCYTYTHTGWTLIGCYVTHVTQWPSRWTLIGCHHAKFASKFEIFQLERICRGTKPHERACLCRAKVWRNKSKLVSGFLEQIIRRSLCMGSCRPVAFVVNAPYTRYSRYKYWGNIMGETFWLPEYICIKYNHNVSVFKLLLTLTFVFSVLLQITIAHKVSKTIFFISFLLTTCRFAQAPKVLFPGIVSLCLSVCLLRTDQPLTTFPGPPHLFFL